MKITQFDHTNDLSASQKAYRNIQRLRKKGAEDRDYKGELKGVLEEKYVPEHFLKQMDIKAAE